MDFIQTIFFIPLIGFAIYGINCFAEKFQGRSFTPQAQDNLDDIWKYCERNFFGSLLRDIKKAERKIKPCIIDIALKYTLDDIEAKGKKSELSILIEKDAKIIYDLIINKNV